MSPPFLHCYALLTLALAGSTVTGCATPEGPAARTVSYPGQSGEKGTSEAALQEALFRFESQFQGRITEALSDLVESQDQETRRIALARQIAYSSAALEIVLGVDPASNLLDMITFIELSRQVAHRYWIPEVLGERGEKLGEALDRSARDAWTIADLVATPAQKGVLMKIIRDWQRENPNVIRVEVVRLSQFALLAASQNRRKEAGGLFASVNAAVVAADDMRMVAERGLYYTQRAPFLLRMQANLGVLSAIPDINAGMKDALGRTFGLVDQTNVTLASIARTVSMLDSRLSAIQPRVFIRTGSFLIGIAFAAMVLLKLLDHRLRLRRISRRGAMRENGRSRRAGARAA